MMVKKQQLAVGGVLTCVFSSSSRSINNKQQDEDDTASPPSAAAACQVLPSSYSPWWQWQWTSCGMRPRTLSFRQQHQQTAEQEKDDAKHGHGHHRQQKQEEAAYYKTKNSVSICSVDFSGDSSFSSVDSTDSTASDQEAESSNADAVILQALRSERLLYEPPADDLEQDDHDAASCCRLIKQPSPSKHSINKQKQGDANNGDDKPQLDTSSIVLSSGKAPALETFGGATAMSVESHNPYREFRESMEAMVMSKLGQEGGIKDWRWLEEMLGWYLRANGKATHGLIVAAFVDLLVAAADYNYSSSSSSSSPVANHPASATNCSAASSIDNCSCCSPSSL